MIAPVRRTTALALLPILALFACLMLSAAAHAGEPTPPVPGADLDALRARASALRPALQRAVAAVLDPDDRSPAPRKAKALEDTAMAFMAADQAYLRAWYDRIAALDKKAQARHIQGAALIKHCEDAETSDDVGALPIARLWYAYMRGKTHGLTGAEKKAREVWSEALDDPDLDSLPEAAREALRSLKQAIAHDYVKLVMRAAEFEPARYGDAAQALEGFTLDEDLSAFMDTPPGCALRIDYARALIRMPDRTRNDYVEAMRQASKVFDHGGGWEVEACKAMAEAAGQARATRVYLDLPAGQWYAAARGFLIHGLTADERAQELYDFLRENENLLRRDKTRVADCEREARALKDEARTQFESAVFFYQLAVLKCREGDAGFASSPLPAYTPTGELNAEKD